MDIIEILKFLGLILLIPYLSFSMFLILMIISNRLSFTYSDDKEHSRTEYLFDLIKIVVFWPYYLIKADISKED